MQWLCRYEYYSISRFFFAFFFFYKNFPRVINLCTISCKLTANRKCTVPKLKILSNYSRPTHTHCYIFVIFNLPTPRWKERKSTFHKNLFNFGHTSLTRIKIERLHSLSWTRNPRYIWRISSSTHLSTTVNTCTLIFIPQLYRERFSIARSWTVCRVCGNNRRETEKKKK